MFTRREEKRGAWGLNMRVLGMSVAKKLKKGFEGKSIGGRGGGPWSCVTRGNGKDCGSLQETNVCYEGNRKNDDVRLIIHQLKFI